MVARHGIKRGEIVKKIHRLDHLLAVPDLALEGRVEEVAGVQDAHVMTVGRECPHQGRDTTEPATPALLDRAYTVGVIEMDKSQRTFRSRSAAGAGDEQQ